MPALVHQPFTPKLKAGKFQRCGLLGGSWVVITRVTSRATTLITLLSLNLQIGFGV